MERYFDRVAKENLVMEKWKKVEVEDMNKNLYQLLTSPNSM